MGRRAGVVSVPIDTMLAAVEWKAIDLTGCSFVGEPDALYATHEGVLELGDLRLRCYTLNDGQRVFDADDLARFFDDTLDAAEGQGRRLMPTQGQGKPLKAKQHERKGSE